MPFNQTRHILLFVPKIIVMQPRRLALWGVVMALLAIPLFTLADDLGKQPRPYVLTTCVVSGEKLGEVLGTPYVYIYKTNDADPGREIKFCCKSCLKDFNKDPEGYIKKLDAAELAAKRQTAKNGP